MHLFFDLDGTLTDSFPGISRCINYALRELGRDPIPETQVRSAVGTPLASIFGALLGSSDTNLIDRAVRAYRVRFDRVGIFENSLYPGITEALDVFHRFGYPLQVVTVKPAIAARRVIAHFGIDHYFAAVQGPELADRTCSKVDLLRAAVNGVDRLQSVMIGDRVDDIIAARENGVRAVAVAWGYSGASELEDAKPDFVAKTVPDLVTWVQAAG
jgi:phosphoglycolate phosphatase